MRKGLAIAGLLVLAATAGWVLLTGSAAAQAEGVMKTKLAVLWTSGDPDVAHKVCFMYTHNAKRAGWFDEVLLIVWGPSQRLLVADQEIQDAAKAMMADGVRVQACVACASSYGVVEQIEALGIEVKGMGKPLTDILQSDDWETLSF